MPERHDHGFRRLQAGARLGAGGQARRALLGEEVRKATDQVEELRGQNVQWLNAELLSPVREERVVHHPPPAAPRVDHADRASLDERAADDDAVRIAAALTARPGIEQRLAPALEKAAES